MARSPIYGGTPWLVYRRPYKRVVGQAQTRQGAVEVMRALFDKHQGKTCLCAVQRRICCDERGYVPNRIRIP